VAGAAVPVTVVKAVVEMEVLVAEAAGMTLRKQPVMEIPHLLRLLKVTTADLTLEAVRARGRVAAVERAQWAAQVVPRREAMVARALHPLFLVLP
jgi:hypothetical protein